MFIKRLNRFGAAVWDQRLLRLIDYIERRITGRYRRITGRHNRWNGKRKKPQRSNTERYDIEKKSTEKKSTEKSITEKSITEKNSTEKSSTAKNSIAKNSTVKIIIEKSNIEKNIIEKNNIRLLSAVLFLFVFVSGCSGRSSTPVLETYSPVETAENERSTESRADLAEEQPEKPETGSPDASAQKAPDQVTDGLNDLMTVHVCGAVQKQGVYILPQGSRICDAVDAAGGFAADADTSWLNLAAVVEDASQIRIPTIEETQALRDDPDLNGAGSPYLPVSGQRLSEGEPSSGEDDRIDINTASREELMTLPGIGEVKAGQIISYREKNGRFETVEDIMKVPGIKKAGFEKLKEYITVR